MLVVLTVWPEGELNTVWDDWLDAIVDADHGEVWDVPRLAGEDLSALIRSRAPRVTEADAKALTASMSTPLMVEMWITSPKIQRRINRYDGALPVDEDVLRGIPRTLAEVYRQRWDELSPQVKQALTAAVALARKNDVPVFLREIVSKAAAFMADQDDLAEGLALAAEPAAWTMIHQQVDAFREAPLASQARAALDLDHDDEIELKQAAVTELHHWITKRLEGDYWLPSSATTSVAAEWLVSLNPNRFDTPSDIAAAWLHARNLADAFQYQPATDLLSQALTHCPLEHDQAFDMRLTLGFWLNQQGRVQEAIECLETLVTDTQRVLGPDHPDALASREHLAGAYLSAGDLKRAIPLYEQNLTDYQRILGPNHPDHPDILAARNNLAAAYLSAGDLKRAIPLYEQNLTDRERVLGLDHPDTLATRNNLAAAYKSAGKLNQAIPLYEQNLTDTQRVLGPDHPSTLATRNNLAYAYKSAGDLNQAIPLYEQNLTNYKVVLGPNHPDTFTSRDNLASAYESAGDLNRAIPLYAQNLADCESVLGLDHPDTLTYRDILAAAYLSAGDLNRAIPLYKQTLTNYEHILGPNHQSTLATRINLAKVYLSAGDFSQAIPQFEQTLTDFERVLGPDHPDTIASRNNLAYAYLSASDLSRAIPQFEQTLTDFERVLGPDHPDTLTTRNNLAAAYQIAKDSSKNTHSDESDGR